jgi:hypothetical protein
VKPVSGACRGFPVLTFQSSTWSPRAVGRVTLSGAKKPRRPGSSRTNAPVRGSHTSVDDPPKATAASRLPSALTTKIGKSPGPTGNRIGVPTCRGASGSERSQVRIWPLSSTAYSRAGLPGSKIPYARPSPARIGAPTCSPVRTSQTTMVPSFPPTASIAPSALKTAIWRPVRHRSVRWTWPVRRFNRVTVPSCPGTASSCPSRVTDSLTSGIRPGVLNRMTRSSWAGLWVRAA